MSDTPLDTGTLERFNQVLHEAGISEKVKSCYILHANLARTLYSVNSAYILKVASLKANSNFEREISNLQQVAHLPKVPALLGWGVLPGGDDRPYLLLTKIQGDTLLMSLAG